MHHLVCDRFHSAWSVDRLPSGQFGIGLQPGNGSAWGTPHPAGVGGRAELFKEEGCTPPVASHTVIVLASPQKAHG